MERAGTIAHVSLLERDDDLAALAAWLGRARTGQGGLVLVSGESGAGKSTLLQAFTDAGPDDIPVLWGACDPLTPPRPLGPVHDLASQLGANVVALLQTARQPHEIFTAVFEHLRLQPSVLVVDDLHWADQGTIDLLRFLLRRIRITRSLVVGAARDDEISATHPLRLLLGDIARSPDAETRTLAPLSPAAIATLIEDRPVDPAWLHRLTGGNPFYVVEMLEHDEDRQIPRTVRDAILARTNGLGGDAWDLLHLLACAPEAIPDQLLVHLGIGLPVLRAVDLAGLIRRGPRGIAFRHDLCRMAIASTLPPGGEVALHGRMLAALEASHQADPAVLAHHALGAGDAERTLRYAAEAGRAAARSGAHRQAAAFFQTALAQGKPASAAAEAELLELLASESYLIDRLDDAIAASERAMLLRERSHDPSGVSGNHHALAVYQWYNANRDVAVQHAVAAEDVLRGAGDGAGHSAMELCRLGHAFAMQAFLAAQANDVERARLLVGRAHDVAAGIEDPTLVVRARLISGICDVLEGDRARREATLRMLRAAHEHFDEIYSSGYSNLTYLDVEQRRLQHAAELLGFSLPLTIERDLPICRVWQLGSRGRLQLLRGDWSEALADADQVLGGPSAPLARTWPHLIRGLIRLRRGGGADVAASPEPDLDEAWRLACRFGEPMRLLPAAAALAERAWLRGLADARLADARTLLDTAPVVGMEWARGELATWLGRLGEPVDVDLGAVAEPYRLQLSGSFEAAAAAWARLAAPYEQSLALVDCGTSECTRAGLDLLDQLGAAEVAAKVRLDLRRSGATIIPARRRTATMTNPAGLTSREVEILGLLADGSTNAEIAQRLFLSTKTVDHHVSALLSKLQVASRRDAVRRGSELGIVRR
jgi:DNA-binding CsgD family transcriptional regulator